MSVQLTHVTEGEFVRLLETKTIIKFIAQESIEDELKFCLVGINPHQRLAYAIRHGREDKLRTWRLDNLGKFLQVNNVAGFEVQFRKED